MEMNGTNTVDKKGTSNNGGEPSSPRLCAKCKEHVGLYTLRRNNSYCRDCLEEYLSQKVRGALCKRGGLIGGEKVGLCFSGGMSSLCATYLIEAHSRIPSGERRQRKKVPFDMTVFHVDLLGENVYQDARVEKIMEQNPPWCPQIDIVKAEDVLFQEQMACGENIKNLIDSVSDSTGREDLKMILIRETMLAKAMMEGWSYILMANTADARAREAVAATAKGQGFVLSSFSCAIDSRYGEGRPRVVYCMKDVSQEEVDCLSSALLGEDVVQQCDVSCTDKKNIHNLADVFTKQLQMSNPGGVSNIMSSVAKLTDFDWEKDNPVCCPLCWAPMHEDEVLGANASETPLASVCESCKVGVFGCLTNEELAQSEHASQIFNKLPDVIRNRILNK